MIVKNTGLRDYRFRLHVDPSSLPTDYVSTFVLEYTWGQAYYHGITPLLWHGWRLTVTMYGATSGGSPASYKIEFESPWDGTNFVETGSGLHEWYFSVYMRNARLKGGCDEAVLTFDELELARATTENGTETSLYTIGSQTYTNTSYDPRKNRDFIQPTVSGPSASPGAPTCPATIAAALPASLNASAGLGFGYKFSKPGLNLWRKDTIEFDNDDEFYGSCPCSATVGDVVYDEPPLNSEWIVLTASFSDQYSRSQYLHQIYTCPGSSTPIVNDWKRIRRILESHTISAEVHRRSGPMREREIVTTEFCDDDGTTATTPTTVTVDDGKTICLKHTLDSYGDWSTLCPYETSTGPYDPCLPPDGYEPDVPDPDPIPYCYNTIQIAQEWVLPDCLDALGVDYTVAPDKTHFRAIVYSGSVLVTERADNAIESWNSYKQAFLADYAAITAFKTGPGLLVALTYSRSGTVYLRTSQDGETWSMSITIGAGTHSKSAGLDDTRLFVYRFDTDKIIGQRFDAALNLIEAEFDAVTGVDEAAFGVFKSDYGQSRQRIVIQCVIAGAVTQFESDDGINFS